MRGEWAWFRHLLFNDLLSPGLWYQDPAQEAAHLDSEGDHEKRSQRQPGEARGWSDDGLQRWVGVVWKLIFLLWRLWAGSTSSPLFLTDSFMLWVERTREA